MGSYYDVDAILTDAQKVPCTFDMTVPGLGYLEGNPGQEIKEGTKIELPLWLAEMLAVSQSLNTSSMATIDMPSALSTRVMNALKADPKTVDLRSQAPHFFSLGARMLELFEEDELADVLTETFKKRAAEIADHAHNPRGAMGEGVEFLRGLDESERQLFRAAHDNAKATRAWMTDLKKHKDGDDVTTVECFGQFCINCLLYKNVLHEIQKGQDKQQGLSGSWAPAP